MDVPSTEADQASLRIAAPPARIWELVTDVEHMGRLSPECTGGRWLHGADRPLLGGRFKGANKRGWARWTTTNTVVTAEPNRAFAFETAQSGTRWRYDLEADGDATVVTETREPFRSPPLVARLFAAVALGGIDDHGEEVRHGMIVTLQRLKTIAEDEPTPGNGPT